MRHKLLELSTLLEQVGTVLRAYAIFGTVPTLSQLISGVRVLRERTIDNEARRGGSGSAKTASE